MSGQPKRAGSDGPVEIIRNRDGALEMRVETYGATQVIECSDHNAWRLFALLSLMLGIDLPKRVTKGIKL